MWLYLTLLLLPPGGATASHLAPRARPFVYLGIGAALVLIIGLRYHVGCDWNMYLLQFLQASSASLGEALTLNDPGYMLVNWSVAQFSLSIAAVNTICALILATSLLLFCRQLPRPWLGLFISLPIIILIAGFSATRQSVAIACVLLALYTHWTSRFSWAGIPLLLLGATFHESALALIPVLLLMKWKYPRRATASLGLLAAAGCGLAILALLVPFTANLLAGQPTSGGAWMRAVPIALALAAFPIVWQRSDLSERERSMLFWLAAFAVGCLVSGVASPFLMDRFGFYTVPFQMLVLTRLGDRPLRAPAALALNAAIAAPFLGLFLGWLMVGTTAACAIPYRTFLAHPGMLHIENTRTAFKFNHITDTWGVFRPLVEEATARANANHASGIQKGMTIQ